MAIETQTQSRIGLKDRVMLWVDRIHTLRTHEEQIAIRRGNSFEEEHPRGGERVVIEKPDSSVLSVREHDIILELDRNARLVRRYPASRPPIGYRLLSQELRAR